MQLTAQWVNATRVGKERAKVEKAYADRLLALCGGPVEAFHHCNHHYQVHQHPSSKWGRMSAVAHADATKDLLPSECRSPYFRVGFWLDGHLLNP
jgi:hypothetical protein